MILTQTFLLRGLPPVAAQPRSVMGIFTWLCSLGAVITDRSCSMQIRSESRRSASAEPRNLYLRVQSSDVEL